MAVEIAEQFVALSKPDSGYTVTGVVNAPVLSALRNPLNTPWVTLGKRLGSIAAKLASGASFQGLNVEIVTQGQFLT